MSITIKDVAREAGVSTATVSHALNGFPEVAEETRRRVRETADRLGYVPNINGRNLASKCGYRIALLLSGMADRNWRDTTTFRRMQGVCAYCAEHEIEVAVYAVDPGQLTYSQFCRSHAVQGAILMGGCAGEECLDDLMEMPVPFVAMDLECLTDKNCGISIDQMAAAAELTEYLIGRGHTDILVLAGSRESAECVERLRGVMAAMERAEHPLQHTDILYCGSAETVMDEMGREQAGYRRMQEYLAEEGAGTHTAVLCLDDFLALGAGKAIREAGIRIPQELSLTSFAATILGEYTDPPLTTMEWDPYDCGYGAAELLHGRMQNKPVKASPVPCRIVVRGSVR